MQQAREAMRYFWQTWDSKRVDLLTFFPITMIHRWGHRRWAFIWWLALWQWGWLAQDGGEGGCINEVGPFSGIDTLWGY